MATGECYDPYLAVCSELIDCIVYLIDGWFALFSVYQYLIFTDTTVIWNFA
jgi:hypothetical protein